MGGIDAGENPAARLRNARLRAGFASATDAARAFGWAAPTYLAHENGGRGIPLSRARAYARAFHVSPAWLLTGEGDVRRITAPLVGHVGAGAQIFAVDDHAQGAGLDEVEAPPNCDEDVVAVQVRGDSMYPVYWDGDLLFFRRNGAPITENCLNRECVIRLRDGRTLLKILRKNTGDGLYRLESYNAPLIEGVSVDWAAPVSWVDKRHRRPV